MGIYFVYIFFLKGASNYGKSDFAENYIVIIELLFLE